MSCAVVVDGAVVLPAADELVVLAGENVLDTTLISSSEDSDSLDLDSFDSDFCESSLSSLLESFSSELNLDCTESDESDESDESNRLRK